jgi:hypothetical protein
MIQRKTLYLSAASCCFLDAVLTLPVIAFDFFYLVKLPPQVVYYWETGIAFLAMVLFLYPLLSLKYLLNKEMSFPHVNLVIALLVFWEILGTSLSFFPRPGYIFGVPLEELQIYHLNFAGVMLFFLGNRISLLLKNPLFNLKRWYANFLMVEGFIYVLVPMLPILLLLGILTGMGTAFILGLIFLKASKS